MKSKRKVLVAFSIAQRAYVRGVVRYAREHDWHLVMNMVYTGRVPVGFRGDGIITILGYGSALADFVVSAQVPAVALTLVNHKVRLPRVEGDNREIGRLAAVHFLERGYRHFVWAPFMDDVMNAERFAGWKATLRKHGHHTQVLPVESPLRGPSQIWARRRSRLMIELRKLPQPLAVFAYNDLVAADVIDVCRDAGLKVPEQVAVLGVDNDPDVCDCSAVPLSSVAHDLEGMAYQGSALLDRLMDGAKPPKRILRVAPGGVVTRVSTDMRAVDDLKVALALRFIAEGYADPLLSVVDVAAAAGASRRALERSFQKEIGRTIHDEIHRARLAAVEKLLRESTLKIVDIARATGFSRPNHLFRVFRKQFKTSPRLFRLRCR